jgi:hypothetical protein
MGSRLNQYYQITWSKLPEGSSVESTTGTHTQSQKDTLTEVSDFFLNNVGSNPNDLSGALSTVNDDFQIPAGGNTKVLDFSGEGAIAEFKIKPDDDFFYLGSAEQTQYLKELTVSMYWDGEAEPSVWAPLGDFFADPVGADPYNTLPMGCSPEGEFYCYIFMPFTNGAEIVIGNDGSTAKGIHVSSTVVPLSGDGDDYLRFHAKWHRGEYSNRIDKGIDYSILNTTGAG